MARLRWSNRGVTLASVVVDEPSRRPFRRLVIDVLRMGAGIRGWCAANGHVVLAVAGSLVFVALRPPVADLQAADARAAAAVHGVGLGYWLSWFGGTAPGGTRC